jgi:hypothetical protein
MRVVASQRLESPYDIDWLLGIGRALLQGDESPEAMARRLGEVTLASPTGFKVAPADGQVEMDVVIGVGRPNSISLKPKSATALPRVAQLEERLGAAIRGVKSHPRAPLALIYRLDLDPKSANLCTIIAYVDNDGDPEADWRIDRISVFPEIRI